MSLFFIFGILLIYLFIKFILKRMVKKYGKISYDGFSAVGFSYDSKKDIFHSTKNAWQKNFGYTHAYDVFAPIFRMIIDTEPIRFYYNHKNWLITFWKGQYGIVTGAEIGVYCTKQQRVNKATIYFPVSDEEMLDMEFTLYRKNRKIATVKEKHWWLVIFKLGIFSWPKNLSMDIKITFPNVLMLKSFLYSFTQLGYTTKEFKIKDRTFSFYFTKPHTKQVNTRIWYKDWIRQFYNYKNVVLYNKTFLQLIDNNKIDDSKTSVKDNVIMINQLLPSFIKNQLSKDKKSKRWIRRIGKILEEKILSLENDSPVKENDDE